MQATLLFMLLNLLITTQDYITWPQKTMPQTFKPRMPLGYAAATHRHPSFKIALSTSVFCWTLALHNELSSPLAH